MFSIKRLLFDDTGLDLIRTSTLIENSKQLLGDTPK